MYLKYNAVLRGLLFEYMRDTFESLCKGNRYTTTLHAMNSTVVKLSKLTTALLEGPLDDWKSPRSNPPLLEGPLDD